MLIPPLLLAPVLLFLLTTSRSSTTHFDISTSTKNTLNVLTPLSTSLTTTNSTPTLTLHLHPRVSLHGPHYPSYRNLSLERLVRDSSRASSILARIHVALSGHDLSPSNIMQAPVVSGATHGSGEYFAQLGFGSPPRPMYVVLDTGSDVSWIQCRPCTGLCYSQTDPIFDPLRSKSYSPLGCRSLLCAALDVSSCRNSKCLYQVSYGDGSYTIGEYAIENVSFGLKGLTRRVALGCGHDNEGLFVGAAGLIGLGGGRLSLTSQIKAMKFSYCFVDRDTTGSSTLEFDTPRPSDSITAPLLRNPKIATFFYVGLTGLTVGGRDLRIPPSTFYLDRTTGSGGVIVDSGTAVTRFPRQAYVALRDAFRLGARSLRLTTGVALFDTCYDLSGMDSAKVPSVGFRFGIGSGKVLMLPAKNYLVPVDSKGTFCFAFAGTDSSPGIIGNIQQQGMRVSYGFDDKTVGFSSNKC